MGQMWINNQDGIWAPGFPAMRTAAGWINGRLIYQKTSSTIWTIRWTRDTSPPAAPTAQPVTYTSPATAMTIHATAPSTVDTQLLRIKVSTTAYPSSPTDQDAYYYSNIQSDGSKWSDVPVVPSQVISRVFPPSGSLVFGQKYYISIWAMDTSYNFSVPATATITIPFPTTPPPATVTKSAFFLPADSASYSNEFNSWRTSDNYVYSAGAQDWRGLWFYSNRITTGLAKAKKITAMSIYIGRVNSAHGVASDANVRLMMHGWSSQPGGDPLQTGKMSSSTLVGSLNRGQYKTFTVPESDWDNILNASSRGFGLHYTTTSYTDNDYIITYGAGTNSGRLYIQWQE